MQSDLVCGKQFLGQISDYRPTFGTGLGWFTSIFGYFYNNIWVKYFLFRDVVLQMRLKYPY